MGKVRRIDVAERRARLGIRHHLARAARSTDVVAVRVISSVCTRPIPQRSSLSAAARLKQPADAVPSLERALYDDHTLVRTLGMRRTMFVLPRDLVPAVQAGVTDALVPAQRKRLVREIEENGITTDGARWLRTVERDTLAALDALGEATGAELSKAVPALRTKLSYGEGKTWAGTTGVTTRLLFLLSTEQQRGARPPHRNMEQHAIPLVTDGGVVRGRNPETCRGGGAGRTRARVAREIRTGDDGGPQVVDRLAARSDPDGPCRDRRSRGRSRSGARVGPAATTSRR